MRRICFIGGYSNGGTETATFLTANMLCHKYEIYLLNISSCEPLCKLDKRIHMDSLEQKGSIVKKSFKIFKYIKNNKIDIVINVEADVGLFTIPISLITRQCKYIIWEHANLFQIHNRFIPYIRRYAIKHFSKYILLTERDKRNFMDKYGNSGKYETIYNSIELPDDTFYSLSSKIIISAGHHLPIKNFEAIADVGRIVFSRHRDWRWEIYGERRSETYEKLLLKISRYGLENNRILKPRSNDMPGIYKKSAIYVLTSLMEGLPMVLLEAKAYRLPIVSFDIETGPDEIVDDGVNGYLIEPYNVEEMADRICELIEKPELRKQFSDNAYIGIEKFDKNKIAEKWISVLESLDETKHG